MTKTLKDMEALDTGQIKVQYNVDGIEGICVVDLTVNGEARG